MTTTTTTTKFSNRFWARAALGMCCWALLAACQAKPEPIDFAVDKCENCKMNISDARFAAELVTTRGKVYKFDAIECLAAFFLDKSKIAEPAVHSLWVMNYAQPGSLIDARDALYAQHEELRSPMSFNAAAFREESQIAAALARYPAAKRMSWNETLQRVRVLAEE